MARLNGISWYGTPALIGAGVRLLVLGLLLVLATPPAQAGENETFGVVPHPTRVDAAERRTFEIPLEVGTTFEDAVRIYNRTDRVVRLAVYSAEAVVGDDDVISIGFRGARPAGLASWITIERETVELLPRGEEIVSFRVRIANREPDPDLAAIVVENAAEEADGDLDIVQRVAILVRTAPEGTPTAAVPTTESDSRLWLLVLAGVGGAILVLLWLRRRASSRRDSDEEATLVPPPPISESAWPPPAHEPEPVTPSEAPPTVQTERAVPDTPGPEQIDEQEAPTGPVDKPRLEEPPEPPVSRPEQEQPTRRKTPKRNYIPLDEL